MRIAIFIGAGLVAAAVFLMAPWLDLSVSSFFWREGEGFFLRDWPLFRFAHDRLPWLTGTIAVFLLAGILWWAVRRRQMLWRRRVAVAVASSRMRASGPLSGRFARRRSSLRRLPPAANVWLR